MKKKRKNKTNTVVNGKHSNRCNTNTPITNNVYITKTYTYKTSNQQRENQRSM